MTATLNVVDDLQAGVVEIRTTFAALGRLVEPHGGLLLLSSPIAGFTHEVAFDDEPTAHRCAADLLVAHWVPAVQVDGTRLHLSVPDRWVSPS